jgi:hypothetical protein
LLYPERYGHFGRISRRRARTGNRTVIRGPAFVFVKQEVVKMTRHVAAIGLVLCLAPAWAAAQTAEFSVGAASARVHKAPSTGSPVIGTAPQGTVLEVTRELGDWVKVSWPSVPDSTGYVHVKSGSLRPASATTGTAARPAGRPLRAAPVRSSSGSTLTGPTGLAGADLSPLAHTEHPSDLGPQPRNGSTYVAPQPHLFGIGGRMGGSTIGFGGSARGWSRNALGAQIEVSRYAITSDGAPGSVTTMEFAPSALYALPDRISDYVWLRPFVGAGANWTRSTQTGFGSTSKLGFQAFGGAEATFSSLPRFTISGDVGYRSTQSPYDGFELGGLRFSLSGHWYLR